MSNWIEKLAFRWLKLDGVMSSDDAINDARRVMEAIADGEDITTVSKKDEPELVIVNTASPEDGIAEIGAKVERMDVSLLGVEESVKEALDELYDMVCEHVNFVKEGAKNAYCTEEEALATEEAAASAYLKVRKSLRLKVKEKSQ